MEIQALPDQNIKANGSESKSKNIRTKRSRKRESRSRGGSLPGRPPKKEFF